MNTYQPREVEWNAPWRWSREALALIARRPLAFGGLSLAGLLLFFASLQVDLPLARFAIVLLLPPLVLGGFLRLAEAADHAQELRLAALLPGNVEAARVLLLAAMGYGAAFAVIFAAGGLVESEPVAADGRWKDYVQAAVAAAGLPFAWVIKGLLFGASITAFSALLVVMFSWFTLPLTQLGSLSLVDATRLGMEAYRLNARRLGLTSVGVLACATAAVLLSFGFVAVLMGPFVGSLLYVSYRDVFLGRRENAPLPARVVGAVAVR